MCVCRFALRLRAEGFAIPSPLCYNPPPLLISDGTCIFAMPLKLSFSVNAPKPSPVRGRFPILIAIAYPLTRRHRLQRACGLKPCGGCLFV